MTINYQSSVKDSEFVVDFVEDLLNCLSGDFFWIEEVFEQVLNTFDCQFQVDCLDEITFGLLIGDFFEDLVDINLVDDIFGYDSCCFFDMIKEEFDTLVGIVLFIASGVVEERVGDGGFVNFLRVANMVTLDMKRREGL